MLGPLAVLVDGREVALGGVKQRTVLAALLVGVGSVVPVSRLVDCVWGETPPATAVGTLRSYVANLRRALEPDRLPRAAGSVLVSSSAGYLLRVPADQVDAGRFTALVESGRSRLTGGRPQDALTDLDQALSLWRGPAYGEFAGAPFASLAAAGLEEARLTAQELRAEAEMAAGRPESAAAGLRTLVAAEPLREHRWEMLALALYRCDRQAESLAVLREARRMLADNLGVEPGPRLRRLEQAVLHHDPDLDLPAPPPPQPDPPAIRVRSVKPSAATDSALAGRADVLSTVDEALVGAGGGRGGLLLVTGEPGIGKTRVAEAAAGRAAELGLAVAVGRCPDESGAPALWPWLSVLRAVVRQGSVPLRRLADQIGLSALLDLGQQQAGDPDAGPTAPEPPAHTPRAMVELLAHAARERPLLVALDDLHWADPDSVRVLRVLTTLLPDLPLLVLATSRDGADLHGPPAALMAELTGVWTRRLPLRRLTEPEVAQVLRHRFGPAVDEHLARVIHQRCGGTPFHVVELARLVPEVGAESLAEALPTGTRDLIRHRLRRLPDGAEAVLVVAAVVGEEFDFEVVASASDVPADTLLELVESTVDWGLLVEAGPVGRFRFSHALVRDTLRQSISRVRLARLHARVAAALEQRAASGARAPGDLLDAIAFHWLAAAPVGHAEPAVTAAVAAARRAERMYAHQHAARLWSAAIEVIDQHAVPTTPAATRRLFDLLVDLGRACCRGGLNEQARTVLNRAIGLARQLDDPSALAVAATVYSSELLQPTREYQSGDDTVVDALRDALRLLPTADSPLRCLALAALAAERYFEAAAHGAGDQHGRDPSAEAVAMARRLGDPELLLRALHVRLQAIRHPDTLAERQALAEEQVELASQPGVSPDWLPKALVRRSTTWLEAGNMAEAQAAADACAIANQKVRLLEIDVHLRWWEALRAGLAGDPRTAEALAMKAYELHRNTVWGPGPALVGHRLSWLIDEGRYQEMEAVIRAGMAAASGGPLTPQHLGLILALQGRIDEARAYCPPAAQVPEPPRDWLWLLQMVLRAYAWVLCGDVESCRWALDRLLPYAGRTVTNGSAVICWGSVDHFLGELAEVAGDRDLAITMLRNAVRHNGELGCVRWQQRSQSRLDELTGGGVAAR
ncbi:BTAD domain-containing putative transcriptional regulator [Goodfellowiella coeruleoviolacea]|uniref:Transcriptional regulatory protein, C terminal n=1 Tax=Goodfellowiella coeruleoviolacea TaxID=334858 RepID=A0AAE3GMW8_9PSEU|nr:BTAD domain-containing putative transcriptional regulator [Goodfellowiella coeruleoviolacea]MCP2170339.1 Transcriptional regulatory protein, C terminal [Goodfellowiella coeruleoviolacea]